jgi:hypothetical protein
MKAQEMPNKLQVWRPLLFVTFASTVIEQRCALTKKRLTETSVPS